SLPVSLTVLIPFRNEEHHLHSLVAALKAQTQQPFGIILVNDHSSDGSVPLANSLLTQLTNARLLQNTGVGKKAAILTGISEVTTEYVLLSDADCIFTPNWTATVLSYLAHYRPKLLIAPVTTLEEGSIGGRLQELDFLSLIGMTFGAGRSPVLCNGANLAVETAVYDRLKPYENNMNIPSGDDIFLLQAVRQQFPEDIAYCLETDATVYTKVKSDWSGFLEQRMRWGGKAIHYSDYQAICLAVLVFLVNAALFLSLLLTCFGYLDVLSMLVLVALKISVDTVLLIKAASFFRKNYLLPLLLPASVLYIVYVPVVAVAGIIMNLINARK
ncbi:MAG: glycosyltransferase, partial [Bacteroidota bacterium]